MLHYYKMVLQTELGGCHNIGSNSRFHHYKVELQTEFRGCHKMGAIQGFTNTR